ncbi:MAG: serine/threonine protein kinase [Proteobacteria bacterium]|nr:serine/threonine protein kinase [Pseudomonadota bacterium]
MQYNTNDIIGGKYRIVDLIGGGAMGAVYKAEHELMGKAVALKILHGDFADNEEYCSRFSREAQAAATLDHQNICSVMDYDTTEEGVSYLVMEYLDGETLKSRLARVGSLSPSTAIHIMDQLLSALACAHACGIVHRDVKPDNIFLIQREGRDDFVKLIDFGIAHIDNPRGEDKTMTHAGMIYGTPQYLAPEQALGEAVDHRTDLYACGCIFYEMLMGVPPFEGKNYIELMNKQISEDPPHLDRSIAQWERLDAVIQKLLNKAAEIRYQSAQEVKQELEAIQALLSGVPAVAFVGGAAHISGVSDAVLVRVNDHPSGVSDAVLVRVNDHPSGVSDAVLVRVNDPGGGHDDIDIDLNKVSENAGLRRKQIIVLLAAIVALVLIIIISLTGGEKTPEDVRDVPDAGAQPVMAAAPAQAEPEQPGVAEPVEVALPKPEPYNYREEGFKISFDAVLSHEISVLNAVENYYSMNYEEAQDALAEVRSTYWHHPNYVRLYVLLQDQLGLTDGVYAGLEHLLEIEPEAVRNPSVAQMMLKYYEAPDAYEMLDGVLSDANPKYAAYSVAWLIIQSPYDAYEERLDHLTDLYNLLNPENVPAWLRDSVRLWEFAKEACETRLELIQQIAAKDYPEFWEYVFEPMYRSHGHMCKNRHRRADCNACMRDWLDAHRPAGMAPAEDFDDEEEEAVEPHPAKPSKPASGNDKNTKRSKKKKDSAPVDIEAMEALPI